MKNISKKYKIILIVSIVIIIIASIIFGVSYAQYVQRQSQTTSNVVVVDCFNIEFLDRFNDGTSSADVNLTNAYAVTDEKGISLMQVPYTFRITNTCDIDSTYQVNLEQLATNGSDLSSDYLRIQFNNSNYNLTDFSTTQTKIGGAESRKIYVGRLNANDSQTFTLRMWIKYSATKEQAGGKSYNGKVVVISVPEESQGSSSGGIAGNVALNTYLKNITSPETVIQDDGTADHNMRYIGSTPSNYVYFNCSTTNPENMNDSTCEKWRVIGVFNSGSYSGTEDQLVKIVRNEYIGNLSWDYNSSGTYTNNWNTAELQIFLNSNDGYYGGASSYSYYNQSTTATTLDISSYSIKNTQRNMIATVNWKTGAQAWDSSNLKPSVFYTSERGSTAAGASGSTVIWNNGKVGLPYMSDYFYATSGGSIGRSTCLGATIYVSNNTNWRTDSSANNNCATNSWLIERVRNQSVSSAWSLVPQSGSSSNVFYVIRSNSNGTAYSSNSYYSIGVLPTLYLNNGVECANCDSANAGSSSNPFKLTYSS